MNWRSWHDFAIQPQQIPALFQRLRAYEYAVWLDSGDQPVHAHNRYHILAARPRFFLSENQGQYQIETAAGQLISEPDPWGWLAENLPLGSELPYSGGAIGYFSYDWGLKQHGLPSRHHPALPLIALGLYDWIILIDRLDQQAHIIAQQPPPAWLYRIGQQLQPLPLPELDGRIAPQALIDFADYAQAFDRIQAYLQAGDCYQINYAQPFAAPYSKDAWPIYYHLRQLNPAAYGAFLDYPFAQILSNSPEHFLGLNQGWIETRPIKGTRPRHSDPEEDQRLAQQLLASAKDRAENIMIVDLMRNDLGRVAEIGSVQVANLLKLEQLITVQHLVSTVRARLAADKNSLDLIKACFPGGSVTGAPKKRAMQIIDELEYQARGVYCGSIGWFNLKQMQLNIAIRSLQIYDQQLIYWAGGGIVYDSKLQAEYQESWHKARALFDLFASV